MKRLLLSLLGLAALGSAGCGIAVSSVDLFVIHRTGQGREVTLLVTDGGTIRCGTQPARPLADRLLLQARDLATELDKDAKAGLHLPSPRGSIYSYTAKLQDGVISFADKDAAGHPELGRAELFTAQAAAAAC